MAVANLARLVCYSDLRRALFLSAEEMGWHAKRVEEDNGIPENYRAIDIRGRFFPVGRILIENSGPVDRFEILCGLKYGLTPYRKLKEYIAAVERHIWRLTSDPSDLERLDEQRS